MRWEPTRADSKSRRGCERARGSVEQSYLGQPVDGLFLTPGYVSVLIRMRQAEKKQVFVPFVQVFVSRHNVIYHRLIGERATRIRQRGDELGYAGANKAQKINARLACEAVNIVEYWIP